MTSNVHSLRMVIADLGGEPTTRPREFEKPDGLKAMLELDLRMEEEDIANYTRRVAEAEKLGLIELKVKL
jgi:bacterioferritin